MIKSLFKTFAQTRSVWWKKPGLRGLSEEGHRQASWLELYYDLVFIAAISNLGHNLVAHLDFKGIMQFIVSFSLIWYVWLGSTFYSERFEENTVRHRIFIFLLMLPIASQAYSVKYFFSKREMIFFIGYLAARLLLSWYWFSAALANDNKILVRISKKFFAGVVIGVIFAVCAISVESINLKIIFWILAIVSENIGPMISLEDQKALPPITRTHLPERFGLLFMLILGESVIGVVNGIIKRGHLDLYDGSVAFLAFVMAFLLWWIYYDHVTYRGFKPNPVVVGFWALFHLPLTGGMLALGSGILDLVYEGNHLHVEHKLLIAGSLFVMFVAFILIGFCSGSGGHGAEVELENFEERQYIILKSISAMILIAIMAIPIKSSIIFIILLLITILANVLQSLYIWLSELQRQEKI